MFKDVFYRELLPELKARGKSVLVITHDDRYFHLADRVIKLDYGKIVYDDRTESPSLAPDLSDGRECIPTAALVA